jgi:uncharacterized protein (UPF0297 family)
VIVSFYNKTKSFIYKTQNRAFDLLWQKNYNSLLGIFGYLECGSPKIADTVEIGDILPADRDRLAS